MVTKLLDEFSIKDKAEIETTKTKELVGKYLEREHGNYIYELDAFLKLVNNDPKDPVDNRALQQELINYYTKFNINKLNEMLIVKSDTQYDTKPMKNYVLYEVYK